MWLIKTPLSPFWGRWSHFLRIVSTLIIIGSSFGIIIDRRSALILIPSVIFLVLVLLYSLVRSIYELYVSREKLRESLNPKIRLEAEPVRVLRTPQQEPMSKYASVKVINTSPNTRIEKCYARIVEFDQILEDGRVLRNIRLPGDTELPRTQGPSLFENSFSPVVLRWSSNELDAVHPGLYYDFNRDASVDVAVIEGTQPSFLKLVTANPNVRNNFNYIFNNTGEHYRLALEVAADNSASIKQSFRLEFHPRSVSGEAQLHIENLKDQSNVA